ncbi:MAG TPA: GGDEF domain-containing protein, partial [Vicinamibacterales bacterium]|nr:GGDEF domain-containing protein [Vicinamibacterales bacterium]
VLAAADLSADKRIRVPAPAAAALALPLVCRGEVVAALVGLDGRPASREPVLGRTIRRRLERAFEPAAAALQSALRLERAEALSVTDDLTQLYNSRYLGQVLRREFKRAARSGRPLSLLFIDLDGFKMVNDRHGHLSGSRALAEAAGLIRASARETDIVARYGGDEFAVVLPETDSEGAHHVGERIRQRIAAHEFLAAEGLRVRLTASVGVATLPGAAASAEELLRAADGAMYFVKHRGKNGIHVAERESRSVS